MMRFINKWLLGLMLCLSTSCQVAKYLEADEILYHQATIKFEGAPPEVSKTSLENNIQQQPNTHFLGAPIRLSIYLRNEHKEKGFGRWKRENLGESPVFYDETATETNLLSLQKMLIDQGYLQATGRYDTSISDGYKAIVAYQLKAGSRYTIDSLDWPTDTTELGHFVNGLSNRTEIRSGKPYQTEALSRERQRLARRAGENGFYGINPSTFYYFLDSTRTAHRADIYLRIAEASDSNRYKRHYIGQTTVYSNYFLEDQAMDLTRDSTLADDIRFIQAQPFVRPSVISSMILQREGSIYRQSLQQKTINRLLGLGTFKFVNQKYQRRVVNDSVWLDRIFYLTPALTQDFSAELEASSLTSSTNSIGAGLNVNYTHRNLFGGAERFDARFSSGIETQLGSELAFINTLNFSLEAKLSLPNFRSPFGFMKRSEAWQARTNALVNGSFQRRTNAFTIASIRTQYGYQWQPNQLQQHLWYPLQINWVNLLDATESFEEAVEENPRLRESFSDYLIESTSYQYSYSEQQPGKRENYFSLQTKAEAAGNIAYLVYELANPGASQPYQLLGLPFAQFFRLETDARYRYFFKKADWVGRLNLGFAIPYGNSNTIPFIRQFFVGGSNSIRAWQIRTLGPGASDAGLEQTSTYNDQTGDIKLEVNSEYRFPIISYLKSAFFIDAGNIWLYPSGENEIEEGVFKWDRFLSQIAVGAGTGLRLDLTFFVLRLDAAIPLRKPYLPAGDRWAFEEAGFGSGPWLQENIVYNLAIGYPF